MFYEVIAQFAKADAPSFKTPGYEEYLSEARDYFNIKSRVATNPKEITELHVIDEKTVRIILRSHDQLKISQVSRSLRVFSMYLIDESHPLNFSELVSGKRLFKMAPIHHHFELSGWPETKVVAIFAITTAVCCLIGLVAI